MLVDLADLLLRVLVLVDRGTVLIHPEVMLPVALIVPGLTSSFNVALGIFAGVTPISKSKIKIFIYLYSDVT